MISEVKNVLGVHFDYSFISTSAKGVAEKSKNPPLVISTILPIVISTEGQSP